MQLMNPEALPDDRSRPVSLVNLIRIRKMKNQQTDMFSGCVLVAEDDFTNQKLITAFLTRVGLDVQIAKDGAQAVEMATARDYDLILMDILMPNMNGLQATIALKQKGNPSPIIAQTAYAIENDRQKCLDAGCDDYITKPLNREKLYPVLSRFLNKVTL